MDLAPLAIIAHKELLIHWDVKLELTMTAQASLSVCSAALVSIVRPTQHHVYWSVPKDIIVLQELKRSLITHAPRDILTMRQDSRT